MALTALLLILLLISVVAGLLFFASYSIKHSPYLRSICQLTEPITEKAIAITFDDGPHPVETPKVLAILEKYKVKATFFLIGKEAERYPTLVKQIADQGHTIGNHAYEHSPSFPLFSFQKMKSDLLKAQELIEAAAGSKVMIFRPPYGVTNPTIAKVVKSLGYQSVGWSLRTFDTTTREKREVLLRIKRRLRPNDIILLHDRVPKTDMLLEELLKYLQEKGFTAKQINV